MEDRYEPRIIAFCCNWCSGKRSTFSGNMMPRPGCAFVARRCSIPWQTWPRKYSLELEKLLADLEIAAAGRSDG